MPQRPGCRAAPPTDPTCDVTSIRPALRAIAAAAVTFSVVGAAACSASDDSPALSASAERGQVLAAEYGCSGCHAGLDSDADVGPTWIGAWGSTVELADGTRAVVDREFVVTAVREPDSQVRAGDWLRMPHYSEFHLPDDDLELIIEYLRALGGDAGGR